MDLDYTHNAGTNKLKSIAIILRLPAELIADWHCSSINWSHKYFNIAKLSRKSSNNDRLLSHIEWKVSYID